MSLRDILGKAEGHFLEYTSDIGDERSLETIELEQQMFHGTGVPDMDNPKGIRGWSYSHDANPKYEGFTAGKLNPKRLRDQRIDENVTYPSVFTYLIPHRLLARVAERKFTKTVGPRAQAAMDAYENTPARENQERGGPSVIDELGSLMLAGESTLVAVAHAESLDDIAINHGPIAIAAARKRSRLINRVGTSLGKTLSLEEYKGKRVPKHFKFFGVIFWTFPESDNLKLYDVPEEAVKIVRDSGGRALIRAAKNGTSITMAPTGSGMKILPEPGPDGLPVYGPQILDKPPMSEDTRNILRAFGHYMVSAAMGDQVKISSIFDVPDYDSMRNENGKKLSIRQKNQLAQEPFNHMSEQLAQLTADVSEMPVRYRIIEKVGEKAVTRLAFPRLSNPT